MSLSSAVASTKTEVKDLQQTLEVQEAQYCAREQEREALQANLDTVEIQQ